MRQLSIANLFAAFIPRCGEVLFVGLRVNEYPDCIRFCLFMNKSSIRGDPLRQSERYPTVERAEQLPAVTQTRSASIPLRRSN